MNLATVLVNTPVLHWEGLDAIGQKARITGDSERGYEFQFYSEMKEDWAIPRTIDEYRWIVEAFLAEMMRQEQPEPPSYEPVDESQFITPLGFYDYQGGC